MSAFILKIDNEVAAIKGTFIGLSCEFQRRYEQKPKAYHIFVKDGESKEIDVTHECFSNMRWGLTNGWLKEGF